jgi:predicted transcriptional regulator
MSKQLIKTAILRAKMERKLSYTQIAKDIDVKYATLYKFIHSDKGSIEIAEKLMNYFQLKIIKIM